MCEQFGFAKDGMIITGDNTYKAAGRTVKEYMEDSGYDMHVQLTGNATLANVEDVVSAGKETKSKFILAVGGGSKIDIAKMVAKQMRIPFISVPTSVAHDGIASGRASLKSDMGPKSVDAVVPMGILADSAIIYKSPYRYLVSGCADVISNITALKDWDFARRIKNEPFSKTAYALSEIMHSQIALL